MLKRVQIIALLFLYLLVMPLGVRAQIANTAALAPPNTFNFPEISTSLKPFNEQRGYVHNLGLEDITILENDQRIAIATLNERQPGTQFVLAISLERAFAIRDSNGISRYDRILNPFQIGQPANRKIPTMISTWSPRTAMRSLTSTMYQTGSPASRPTILTLAQRNPA